MAINESSEKFSRCQEACLLYLRSIHPLKQGHRKIALALMRAALPGQETFCDEMTRRALNALVRKAQVQEENRRYTGGIKMKVFGLTALGLGTEGGEA